MNRPNGTINEQWFFKPQKEGSFSIHSAYNSLVLNIAGGNYFQGDKVVLWNFEDGGNDTWRFVPTSWLDKQKTKQKLIFYHIFVYEIHYY